MDPAWSRILLFGPRSQALHSSRICLDESRETCVRTRIQFSLFSRQNISELAARMKPEPIPAAQLKTSDTSGFPAISGRFF